jgi:hypothetical protein
MVALAGCDVLHQEGARLACHKWIPLKNTWQKVTYK